MNKRLNAVISRPGLRGVYYCGLLGLIVFLGAMEAWSYSHFSEMAANWPGGNCGMSFMRGRLYLWNCSDFKSWKPVRFLNVPLSTIEEEGPFNRPQRTFLGFAHGSERIPMLGTSMNFVAIPLPYPLGCMLLLAIVVSIRGWRRAKPAPVRAFPVDLERQDKT